MLPYAGNEFQTFINNNTMIARHIAAVLTVAALSLTSACRGTDPVNPSQKGDAGKEDVVQYPGMFLLNEGNMGSNKCTLDYYDYKDGFYCRNIFPGQNKDDGSVTIIGDSGNDLQAYGNRLYAVVNGSHLIEVMNLVTAGHLGSVSVPNCRYIAFNDRYAYVSSYAGLDAEDPASILGCVFKIDTASLRITDTCVVGYQPEELAVCGDRMYVANSGGYRYNSGDYDTRVSVIDLNTFEEIRQIEVAPNLHRVKADSYGYIWVSSRGNYVDQPSRLFAIDSHTDKVVDSFDISTADMTVCGDSLYVYGSEWSNETMSFATSWSVISLKTHKKVSDKIITDGTDSRIVSIYGIAVNPETREIFVTDAKDYMTPGEVFCYSNDGRLKWTQRTGDIPSRIVFSHSRCNILQ